MRLDLYQAETARIAADQNALLTEAKVILQQGRALTPLEQAGVLHALQVLVENAIGKAKHWLKARAQPVPVSAYDAFTSLANHAYITPTDLATWIAIVDLRNRIVHDYMNIDIDQVIALIRSDKDQFVVDFLLQDIPL
jgi:uncharacterized protein YutE (UPF0331/DUF86 family)